MIKIISFPPYNEGDVLALYRSVNWSNYFDNPDMLKTAYLNSLAVFGAYDGGRLVGLLRAVGDGASIIFIQDVLVDPGFRRRGVGAALVNALKDSYPEVYQLSLMADDTPEAAAFYGALGFKKGTELGVAAFLKMK